jgi:hypothetical protein
LPGCQSQQGERQVILRKMAPPVESLTHFISQPNDATTTI